MKSLLCTLLVATLAFALAGCAKDTTSDASTTTAQPDQPQPASRVASTAPSAPAPAPKVSAPKPAAKPSAARTFEIPEGTEVAIFPSEPISTGKNKAGDVFAATIAEPIVVNGETIVDRGVKVQGRIIDAEGSGRVKGTAKIRMTLTSIDADAHSYPITTRPYSAEAEATKGRDAGIIAGGAGIGTAIGALAGGKGGAVKGAVIGGVAGTGTVLATKGKEVEFNPETKLTFLLEKSAELPKLR